MMDKSFHVSILPRAELDVDSIYTWLLTRSPMGAQSWFRAFEGALDRLSTDVDEQRFYLSR
jgi:plasmid stabilization system protein ParE